AAAGLTALIMPHLGGIDNYFARTVMGAIIGGTISEATGGKFANGAITGAFQAAMMGKPREILGGGAAREGDPKLARDTVKLVESAMLEDDLFKAYPSELAAHEAFQSTVRRIGPSAEVGVKIGLKDGQYYLGAPYSIGSTNSVTGIVAYGHLPKGTTLSAITHFHFDGPAFLSGTGMQYAFDHFDSDGSVYQAWNRTGDGRSAYNEEINIYSFNAIDYDYFNYQSYRALQRQHGGEVPICFAARLKCP
ncbi:MAG TPA: hypothetical protein VN017_09190, partial [Pseudoxanthomonas sp.]|nr:hypothetical protein [Pseudoxanthomonas sp.]